MPLPTGPGPVEFVSVTDVRVLFTGWLAPWTDGSSLLSHQLPPPSFRRSISPTTTHHPQPTTPTTGAQGRQGIHDAARRAQRRQAGRHPQGQGRQGRRRQGRRISAWGDGPRRARCGPAWRSGRACCTEGVGREALVLVAWVVEFPGGRAFRVVRSQFRCDTAREGVGSDPKNGGEGVLALVP